MNKYCDELPGAKRFLRNFFLSSEGMSVSDVFQNYLMDVDLYAPSNETIRGNKQKMYEAFAEISGLGKANVESMNLVYGKGEKLFEENS